MNNPSALRWIVFGIATFVIFAGSSPEASAKMGDISIEGLIGVAAGPEDDVTETDLGSAFGVGIGLGFEVTDNLQLRVDVSRFKWSEKDSATIVDPILGPITASIKQELTDIAIVFGGRYFLISVPRARPFVEIGLSLNLLEEDFTAAVTSFGSFSISESDTKIGIVPGAGVEIILTPQIGLGVGVRYHFIGEDIGDSEGIDPSFLSVLAMVAYHP